MAYSINENCIGCTLCAKNCPVEAIDGVVKQQHVVNAKRCIECGVCGNFCSKGAIVAPNGEVAVKVPKTEWAKPVFATEKCSACSLCVQACRKKLIAISLPKFKGDIRVFAQIAEPAKCVGCAQCEKACPLHVITMVVPEAPPAKAPPKAPAAATPANEAKPASEEKAPAEATPLEAQKVGEAQ